LNVGQVVRERHGKEAFLVGFTTYTGTVTAASNWDGVAERKHIRPGMDESYELLLHETGVPDFLLTIRGNRKLAASLSGEQLERFIGVIYRPDTERWSHYTFARLGEQFDALIHFDETRALEPLERSAHWERGELPETYPTGL
jgi:erythromycin esterase-like protein